MYLNFIFKYFVHSSLVLTLSVEITALFSSKFIQCIGLICKVYAGDMSPENHQRCEEATEPLLAAVDNLATYASSPEFASVPAKISLQVF